MYSKGNILALNASKQKVVLKGAAYSIKFNLGYLRVENGKGKLVSKLDHIIGDRYLFNNKELTRSEALAELNKLGLHVSVVEEIIR